MTEKSIQESLLEKRDFHEEFHQLQVIKNVLSGHGLNICEYSDDIVQEQFKERYTFPIANDGAQGVRVTRERKGGLVVSFTNGFEDPKNKKRVEVTTALREKGIDVV